MKKALYVATIDAHIKAFHLPYLEMLHDNGYEVHVATNGDEQIPNCDVKHKICIERSPFKIKNLKAIKQLKNIINKEQFDIIHCHTPMGSVVTRLAAKKARKKYGARVIYTVHGFHFYKGAPKLNWLIFYPIEKWLAKRTDELITINQEDYELAKKKFSKRCKNVHYIPGVGIDVSKFNFSMDKSEIVKIRKSMGINSDDFVMIFPARLDKNKNQILLINAMEQLIKKNDKIHLLLPGNDELGGYYQKIVNEKKLNDNIHFLGFRSDIPQLMKISNIAVSSSLREGLPVNIIEALACKLPVVAYNCRGVKDLICNKKNGIIVFNNDASEFAAAILNNDFSKFKIKMNDRYTINNITKKLKKIYFDE